MVTAAHFGVRSPHGREAAPEFCKAGSIQQPHARSKARAATIDATVEKNNQERSKVVPAPLNPARLKQMKAEASARRDPSPASLPARTPTRRSGAEDGAWAKSPKTTPRRWSSNPSKGVGSTGDRGTSAAASEIYEPDWALSPFPSNIVGTFSCHGIEPSYFTDGASRIQSGPGLRRPALRRGPATGVVRRLYDGHGGYGQEVSQFAMEYIRDNLHKHRRSLLICRRLQDDFPSV